MSISRRRARSLWFGAAYRWPTAVLVAAGVPAVERDPFAERTFPDDIYDLVPALFADLDPRCKMPGSVGRGEGPLRARPPPGRGSAMNEPASRRVLAFVPDLMDRSRLSAVPGIELRFAGAASELATMSSGWSADIVVVDLGAQA